MRPIQAFGPCTCSIGYLVGVGLGTLALARARRVPREATRAERTMAALAEFTGAVAIMVGVAAFVGIILTFASIRSPP